jgi:membrane peptidoglycan carboxypeptidase
MGGKWGIDGRADGSQMWLRRKTVDRVPVTSPEGKLHPDLIADPVGYLEAAGFAVHVAPRRSRWRALPAVLVLPTVLGALIGSLALGPTLVASAAVDSAGQWWQSLALPVDPDAALPLPSVMLDVNGEQFAGLYAENRIPVTLDQIPDTVINALVATEDTTFWTHNGVNWKATAKVAAQNYLGDAPDRGASGITQQYVKNLLITQATTDEQVAAATAPTLQRKLQEAATAVQLEKMMSKEDILLGYLNTVYFGNNAYGIGAAAQYYFNKTPADLSVAESALLVGVLQSPVRLEPVKNPQASLQRRDHVINRMVSEEYLDPADARAAKDEELVLTITSPANGCPVSEFASYCEWVRQTLLRDPLYGPTVAAREQFLYKGGLTIRTALDPVLQKKAEAVAQSALAPSDPVANAVALVVPGTGHVPAIASSEPWGQGEGQTEILLPVIEEFQPGSTFKALTAAIAIENGWHQDTLINAPATYLKYKNFANGPGGNIDINQALKVSMNTWFVMLQERIGTLRLAEGARDMGMTALQLDGDNPVPDTLSNLTLGVREASVLQVATAYATLASGGIACQPVGILQITNTAGKTMPSPDPNCTRVLRQSTADTVTELLRDNVATGGGRRAALTDRDAAGKTGTTDDSGAAWFAGYTTDYAAAVWFGDPRGAAKYPLTRLNAFGQVWAPVTGSGAPALLWNKLMTSVHEGLPEGRFRPGGGDAYVGVVAVVPDVRGLDEATATRILRQAGLGVEILTGIPTPGLDSGRVMVQSSASGERVIDVPDRIITLTLSG